MKGWNTERANSMRIAHCIARIRRGPSRSTAASTANFHSQLSPTCAAAAAAGTHAPSSPTQRLLLRAVDTPTLRGAARTARKPLATNMLPIPSPTSTLRKEVGLHVARRPDAAVTIELTPTEQRIIHVLLETTRQLGKGTTVRIAGGWVRDKLLGRDSSDIDVTLDNTTGREFAEAVNEYLRGIGERTSNIGVIAANPEQSKHLETATTRVLDMFIDFVNLRTESYDPTSRIPRVGVGSALEDAERRDFTVNALFYNVTSGVIEDLTGNGLTDLLELRTLRTPLPPLTTFLDDPLRVLRAVRFAARFGFRMHPDLRTAAVDPRVLSSLDAKVSRERVGKETDAMLVGPRPVASMRCIAGMRLMPVVFAVPTGIVSVRGRFRLPWGSAESAASLAAPSSGAAHSDGSLDSRAALCSGGIVDLSAPVLSDLLMWSSGSGGGREAPSAATTATATAEEEEPALQQDGATAAPTADSREVVSRTVRPRRGDAPSGESIAATSSSVDSPDASAATTSRIAANVDPSGLMTAASSPRSVPNVSPSWHQAGMAVLEALDYLFSFAPRPETWAEPYARREDLHSGGGISGTSSSGIGSSSAMDTAPPAPSPSSTIGFYASESPLVQSAIETVPEHSAAASLSHEELRTLLYAAVLYPLSGMTCTEAASSASSSSSSAAIPAATPSRPPTSTSVIAQGVAAAPPGGLKRDRIEPLVAAIMGMGLKLRHRDADEVVSVQSGASAMQDIAAQIRGGGRFDEGGLVQGIAAQIGSAAMGEQQQRGVELDGATRLRLAVLLREVTKERWLLSIRLAAALDLVPILFSTAAHNNNSSSCCCSSSSSSSSSLPDTVRVAIIGSLAPYAVMHRLITNDWALAGCWEPARQPSLNGKAVMSLLGMKAGPALGGYMGALARWTLLHPEGTADGARAFLLSLQREGGPEGADALLLSHLRTEQGGE